MKTLILSLLAVGLVLALGGCASSPNVNPATARPGMGYVDFYTDDADNLYWDVTDLQSHQKVFYQFAPYQQPILRLAFKPGAYELQVNFLNHVITTPGTAQVDVQAGRVTPVIV